MVREITQPKALDYTLGPILQIVFEPFSKKISHWWNWREYQAEPQHTVFVYGSNRARPRHNLWSDLWQTNFGWKDVVVFEPVNYGGPWHLGYSVQAKSHPPKPKQQEWCNVVLWGKAAALLGPENIRFFGLDRDGNPIRICEVDRKLKHQLVDTPLV